MTDATPAARPVIGVDVPWPDELVIEVTQDDIDYRFAGEGDWRECPIARATNRAAGRSDARVMHYISFDGATTKYKLPKSATRLHFRFDTLMSVEPITFTATLIK